MAELQVGELVLGAHYAEHHPHALLEFEVDLQPATWCDFLTSEVGEPPATVHFLGLYLETLLSRHCCVPVAVVDEHNQSVSEIDCFLEVGDEGVDC